MSQRVARRLALIRIMLAELPPDERERVLADDNEWVIFLTSVENRLGPSVVGSMGLAEPGLNSFENYALAVAKTLVATIGTEKGMQLYHDNGLCEVMERVGDKVRLVGHGLVPIAECRLHPDE